MHANRPMAMLLPAPSFAKPDIVRRFLAFAQCAGPEQRAQGASALARAYLQSDLTAALRSEAEMAMMSLLDDPSPLVRRGLAEALAGARDAPRPLILSLAADQPEVAATVLGRSPALTDADLVDFAATGPVAAQIAIAPPLIPTTEALQEINPKHRTSQPRLLSHGGKRELRFHGRPVGGANSLRDSLGLSETGQLGRVSLEVGACVMLRFLSHPGASIERRQLCGCTSQAIS
jgi:hypothetical protein